MIGYLTLKSIAGQLPARPFLKLHKPYVSNLRKIQSIEGNESNTGTARIPISQSLYETVVKEIVKDRMLRR